MYFSSFSEFLQMGGHALYVWSAFGFSIVLITLLLLLPQWSQKKLLREICQKMDREKQQRLNDGDYS